VPALVAILLGCLRHCVATAKTAGQVRERLRNVQFVTGHSAFNIPFELIANIIVLKFASIIQHR